MTNVPDVIGLVGRREGAAESHVLQGRDVHSVRVLVPDCHGVDQKFHDVTIVDMGEVPESSVGSVTIRVLIKFVIRYDPINQQILCLRLPMNVLT